jgi:hypothetical protein
LISFIRQSTRIIFRAIETAITLAVIANKVANTAIN